MSTAKSLQKPSIIGIVGSQIRIKHPDISKNFQTSLSAAIAAAGTTMNVLDTGAITGDGFADNDWFIVGAIGDSETEENDVNGAVTRSTSMTVTNALSMAHEIDAPVTKIYERGIQIFGAATDGGTGTLIASVDAKTATGRQLADAVMIEWHRPYTTYTMISTDTAYNYYYVKFTDGTTTSDASDYVAASGLAEGSVEKMIQDAMDLTNTEFSDNITREKLVRIADRCQDEIRQYTYTDPVSGRTVKVDWDFEVTEDKTSLTLATNTYEYALSGLGTAMKYPDFDQSVISVRIGAYEPMTRMDIHEWDEDSEGNALTDVATQAAAGDTTLVVDSLVEFATSGTIYVGTDEVTYTGVSGTTTFTGIPATGTGAITTTWVVDTKVWQGSAPDRPSKYCIFDGTLKVTTPPDSDYNNYPIKIRYYKRLTTLSEASDVTAVPFTNAFVEYIAAHIERMKKNLDAYTLHMQRFNKIVTDNAIANQPPVKEVYTYYDFQSL